MTRKWKRLGWIGLGACGLLLALPASPAAQSASSSWPPLASGEKLIYNLLWPSGISLGEAVLQASPAGSEIHLEATVVADLPQHHVVYTFSSVATEQLCSVRFRQRLREGSNSVDESYEFDQKNHKVRRVQNGRASESPIPECARDPLTLLYAFRQQLAFRQLAIGTPEAVGAFYLGGDFSVRYEAVTPEEVQLGSKKWDGDRFLITARGPHGEQSMEVWIRPDTARAPVAVKIPFPLARFSAELE